MKVKCACLLALCAILSLPIFGQTTTMGIKIGNNGNISFNNKFLSGNYSEIRNFGKGYHAGVELIKQFRIPLVLKLEASYLNTYIEMDHESKWADENGAFQSENVFYEEITVNNSAFSISAALGVNIKGIHLGLRPEFGFIASSVGRGQRYYDADSLGNFTAVPVQYKFFSNRKQVFNRQDENELHIFEVNRLLYGINAFVSIPVVKRFSVELKVHQPLNEFVREFTNFQNDAIHQKSINVRVSIVYSFPVNFSKRNKKSQKVKDNRKKISSARLRTVTPRNKR